MLRRGIGRDPNARNIARIFEAWRRNRRQLEIIGLADKAHVAAGRGRVHRAIGRDIAAARDIKPCARADQYNAQYLDAYPRIDCQRNPWRSYKTDASALDEDVAFVDTRSGIQRSQKHTSKHQSLMRTS